MIKIHKISMEFQELLNPFIIEITSALFFSN